MHKLVLIRHGESMWNRENRFTGWTDVDLSPQGVEEAKEEFHKLFTQLGIGAEKIEHRRYTSMLIAKILG